jgi:hypothetical protein
MRSSVIVKGEKLAPSLLGLFAQCEVIKPRTPSLTVREKSGAKAPYGT